MPSAETHGAHAADGAFCSVFHPTPRPRRRPPGPGGHQPHCRRSPTDLAAPKPPSPLSPALTLRSTLPPLLLHSQWGTLRHHPPRMLVARVSDPRRICVTNSIPTPSPSPPPRVRVPLTWQMFLLRASASACCPTPRMRMRS
ncbi:hypothetical protein PVAP13_7KG419840 [Panicum virgatum]|uniref:Uncharacterized protein n=1 Tax=Panicum virgatum TaxID=38727 RepID=A0A8T0QQ38_PANVG|nr:hypothetical protein PVAP13_7KG419840 [Panicum virgatum]